MEGNVVHRWDTSYDALFKGNTDPDLVGDSRRHLHGAHLYADGSILASFEYRGLVKLDRCSRLLWRLKRYTHHAILPMPDGSFWAPAVDARKNIRRPRHLADKGRGEDTIIHVSADGKVLEEISIIDAIRKGGYHAILLPALQNKSFDPTHLNDVELVTEELAERIPQVEAGDFLVSLRTPNALAIISRESRAVVWSMVGPFLRQHDPDIVGDGTLLVFDNRSDVDQRTPVRWLEKPQTWGFSRIVRVDPVDFGQVSGRSKGSTAFPFYTSIQGKQQLLGNGNILVSDPEGGRAFEVAPAHGNQVVWEYVNLLEGKGEGHLGRVTEATRFDFDGSQFLNKPCP